jgi:PAS domain-containing protein
VALRESQAAERAARQQGEQLNQELAVINEELRATNDGYLLSTTALSKTQQQLRQLNAELEARVAERTRQLVDQQAMLLQIQSKLPAYLVTFSGPNHVYTYFNEAYGHDLAQGRAELGRTLVDCFPELVEQGFIAALDSVYASGQPITFLETPVVLYDPLTQQARTCYVNMSYHRLHTEAGDPQGMLGFATDVTEQVLARLEREGERRRIERLFREAPAAICILNGPDLVYELVNVNYQQLFPARPLLGKPLLEALPELRASSTWDTLQQVYRTGQTHVDRSVRIPLGRLQDGVLEDVYFDYVFQARTDIQGQSDGVVVFAFDITEQRGAV